MPRGRYGTYATRSGPMLAKIAGLASGQFGMVTAQQIRGEGISATTISSLARQRVLIRVFRGVFGVGHVSLSAEGMAMAAILSAGPGAVLSHRSAAGLHGLLVWNGEIDVLRRVGGTSGWRKPIAAGRHVRPAMIRRTRNLSSLEITHRGGLPVTQVDRTLIDLATVLKPRDLEAAVYEASRRNRVDVEELSRSVEAMRGRRGLGRLRETLSTISPKVGATRSNAEARMLNLFQRFRIREPEVNVWAEGLEVDFLWRSEGLVVEFDGKKYHQGREAFDRDRMRGRRLTLAGYRVLRFTYTDLESNPRGIAEEIRLALKSTNHAIH